MPKLFRLARERRGGDSGEGIISATGSSVLIVKSVGLRDHALCTTDSWTEHRRHRCICAYLNPCDARWRELQPAVAGGLDADSVVGSEGCL